MFKNANTASGSFDNIGFVQDESSSKTLSFTYENSSLNIKRDYSNFTKDKSISKALSSLALSDRADVRSLFTELDFLQNNSDIRASLNSLGSKPYLDNVKISFDFHRYLNDEFIADLNNNNFFTWESSISLSPFTSYHQVRKNADFSSYKAYLAGANTKLSRAINENVDLALSLVLKAGSYDIDSEARLKSSGAFLGLHSKIKLDTFFILTSLRAGIQKDFMQRKLEISNFNDSFKSNYNAISGSELLGFGKDFELSNTFTLTPLSYVEHSFLSTPSIKENDGSSALYIDKNTYHDLGSFIGLNLKYDKDYFNLYAFKMSFLGGYKHSFMNTLKNEAYFQNDNSRTRFQIQSKRQNNDYLRLQSAFDLVYKRKVYSRLIFQSDISKNVDFYARLEAGYKF